jgi:hypothetical protein
VSKKGERNTEGEEDLRQRATIAAIATGACLLLIGNKVEGALIDLLIVFP